MLRLREHVLYVPKFDYLAAFEHGDLLCDVASNEFLHGAAGFRDS